MNLKYFIAGLLGITAVLILISIAVVSTDVAEDKSNQEERATTTTSNNRKSYTENIVVTFTNKAYPTDVNVQNPRLRRYLGKVQNVGNETVASVTFKVEYLDSANKPIKEQSINISQTLKPNFIQEFTFGGLEIPEDWLGKVRYSITDIRFVDDRAYQYYQPISPGTTLDRSPQEIILSPVF